MRPQRVNVHIGMRYIVQFDSWNPGATSLVWLSFWDQL